MSIQKIEVLVELKPEVLDPQGRAIHETLSRIGVKGIEKVKVSKRFVLEVSSELASDKSALEKLAADFLSNPVSETYVLKFLS